MGFAFQIIFRMSEFAPPQKCLSVSATKLELGAPQLAQIFTQPIMATKSTPTSTHDFSNSSTTRRFQALELYKDIPLNPFYPI